jgi:5-(carboxyamino)imidazole ribonucleotide mutase
MPKPPVAIVMGSDSDLPVMREAAVFLESLGIEFALDIVSAHRTPEKLYAFAKTARDAGFKVVIAGAGGSAHLPGMIASLTTLPVIGVPIRSKSLDGMDSLLSIVQMPPGIPVATVAIDGARNAGILAAQILGASDPEIAARLDAFKAELEAMVEAKAERLAEAGYAAYTKS